MPKQKMLKRLFGALAMFSAVLLWPVGVLSAPPAGIQGNVTVQNDETNPVPVTIQTTTEWRVVGVTTTEVDGLVNHDGLIGNAAMHRLCQQEVGPTTRACFAAEAIRPTPFGGGLGWVIRSQNVTVILSGTDFIAIDGGTGEASPSSPTPRAAVQSLDCAGHGFNTIGVRGQVADLNFNITPTSSCGSVHPIACCAPVVIPVTTLP
jgi:hypothetical protein